MRYSDRLPNRSPRTDAKPTRRVGRGTAAIMLGAAALGLPPAQAQQAPASIQLDEVVVQGEQAQPGVLPAFAGGQVARGGRLGLLGNTEALKAPFNSTSYTAELARNLQAQTVADALILDPSVRSSHPSGGIVDSFNIRGFPIGEGNNGEIAFDGVYGVAPNYRVFTDYAERIEVLKGPSAALFGLAPNGGVGGTINIVPKRAGADLTRIGTDFSSDGRFGTSLDVSRRYGQRREFGVRVNGSLRAGDTTADSQFNRTGIGSLALDYQGERFRTWLYLLAQRDYVDAPTRPFLMAPGVAVPRAPSGRNNVIQPWENSRIEDRSALLRSEYDLTDEVTLFADIGGSRSQVERFFGLPTILNARGDTSYTPQFFDLDVSRRTYNAGLRARFDTGFIRHSVTVQASYYQDELRRALTNGTAVTSNIYSPLLQPRQFATRAPRTLLSESDLGGIAISDTLSMLDERVLLTLGLRRQFVETDNYAPATGALTSSYSKSATTPVFGLVLRPLQNVSLYANYIEGLSRGDVAPAGTLNAGESFAPYRTKQYEAGVKAEFGGFGVSLAGFQITKPSGELSAGRFSVSGEQRVRGLELNLYGEVTPEIRLLGGVSLLDGELTKTATAANLGNRPIGVPPVQLNLGAEWDVPWLRGLTLTGALIHTGKQFVNTANTQSLPDWTRLDLGLRYATEIAGRKTVFRANVQNVADQKYWSSVASFGTFYAGAPRTVRLSMTVDL
jgi:iron complex outermembrane receptor protein